jgi:hypothetical protein
MGIRVVRGRVSRRVLGATAGAAAVGGVVVAGPGAPAFGAGPAGPLPQATAQSPQPTPGSPQPTPGPRPVRFFPVSPIFQPYYNLVNGPVVMGQAISPLTTAGGVPAQYFEKARLEDHRATNATGDQTYDFEYGLLVDEMAAVNSSRPVGGDASTVTYATINQLSQPALRVPPPEGFAGDTVTFPDGSVFVPYTADLSPAPGHLVPLYFWDYINRTDLFPGGWLHDIGLPSTETTPAIVSKGRIIGSQVIPLTNYPITVQAFQRTILTYDPGNPDGFQTERANTGTDYAAVFPQNVPQ